MQLDRNTRLKKGLLTFPSGLSVRDAIANARFDVTAGNFTTIGQALNHIAQNELGQNWQDALQRLARKHPDYQPQNLPASQAKFELPWQKSQSPTLAKTATEIQLDNILDPTKITTHKYKKSSKTVRLSLAEVPILISLSDIHHVLKSTPDLVLSGMLPKHWQNSSYHQKYIYQQQRNQLLTAVTGCNLAAYVLNQCQKTKTANRNWHGEKITQAIKHYLNNRLVKAYQLDTLYLGEVLCAALFLGFKLSVNQRHNNQYQPIFLNISSRSTPLKHANIV